jgi:AcrR family transcriptional regulator
VSPRRYTLGERRAGLDATRARIVASAGHLLDAGTAPGGFSIDAVARAAGVARATVYNQFGSRAALLEAVFDARAADTAIAELPAAFSKRDPWAALDGFVAVFVRFWAATPESHRRLRALAVLDPDLGQALEARDERRRTGLRVIVTRLRQSNGDQLSQPFDDVIDVLVALTSFATYDVLLSAGRSDDEVVAATRKACRSVAVALRPSEPTATGTDATS